MPMSMAGRSRMSERFAGVALMLAAAIFVAKPACAHHSFAAYDTSRTVTLTATVETFDWANPHVRLELLAESGGAQPPARWSLESSSPGILERFGWTRGSVRRGDRVTAVFNPMIDGSRAGRLHTLTFVGSGKVLNTKLSVCLARVAQGQPGFGPSGKC